MAVTITNSAGNRFTFSLVNNVVDRDTTANIDISAPGQKAESTTVINLSGLKRFISFDFKLVNDGNDKSNGSNIITVDQQYDYLKNTVLTGKTDEEYTLVVNTRINVTGLLIDNSLRQTFENNVSYVEGSIQIQVGKNPFKVTV